METEDRFTPARADCPHPETLARFFSKVDRDSEEGCWVWVGASNGSGYGKFRHGGKSQYAHRLSYEWHIGEIPEGFQLDHLCRNRSCVNPSHLEPVTARENTLRGDAGRSLGSLKALEKRQAWERAKTRCPRQHEYDNENTYVDKAGRRHCRKCDLIRTHARRGKVA